MRAFDAARRAPLGHGTWPQTIDQSEARARGAHMVRRRLVVLWRGVRPMAEGDGRGRPPA